MKTKKGDIWVSAILYFGLGIVIITILLVATTPVVNRLRDKNIILQTKDVFQVLDANVREVAREGPGAQRPLTVEIRKGQFEIDDANQIIRWEYGSKALLAEPCEGDPALCEAIFEGNLQIRVFPGGPSNSWNTQLTIDYENLIYLNYVSAVKTIAGTAPLVIRNVGTTCGPGTQNPSDPDSYASPSSGGPGDECWCDAGVSTTCTVQPRTTIAIQQRAA